MKRRSCADLIMNVLFEVRYAAAPHPVVLDDFAPVAVLEIVVDVGVEESRPAAAVLRK